MNRDTGNIFLVDDDPVQLLFMDGILSCMSRRIETFERPEALLTRLTKSDRGCVVLDLEMPGLNGLELQRALFDRGVAMPLLFVSGRADVAAVVAAMKQGAVDFLSKPVEPGELCAVVTRALRRDVEIGAKQRERDLVRARWATLSPRQREVCRLLATGMTDKQICAALGTAGTTVQAQRVAALEKLRVASTVELARLLAEANDGG
jgi:FixJ family two-component response regulator